MQSIETLQREHRVVTLVADAARSNLLEERSGGGARVVEIDRFIDFFRHYTIACHHPQEEDLLFAALERRGMSWLGYPLDLLIDDRHALRTALDTASDALFQARAGDEAAAEQALDRLAEYLDPLMRHVQMEEEILLPMAARWLSAADLEALDERFAEIACDEVNEGMREYYTGMACELVGTAALPTSGQGTFVTVREPSAPEGDGTSAS